MKRSVVNLKLVVGMSSALMMAVVLALMLTTIASAKSPILHRVSVGSPDACIAFGAAHPGCDGNFSLNAIQYADGSVSGQYTDRFARGDGFHAVIDCLSVVGNDAWVSGVITSGIFTDPDTGEVFDLTGLPVATRVRDNGTSANDPADQISFSIIGDPIPCTDQVDFPLFDTPQGQVTVR
jgi:hypothetical protein